MFAPANSPRSPRPEAKLPFADAELCRVLNEPRPVRTSELRQPGPPAHRDSLRNEIRTLLDMCLGRLDAEGLAAAAERAIVEQWDEQTFDFLVRELASVATLDGPVGRSLMGTATKHQARAAVAALVRAGWSH